MKLKALILCAVLFAVTAASIADSTVDAMNIGRATLTLSMSKDAVFFELGRNGYILEMLPWGRGRNWVVREKDALRVSLPVGRVEFDSSGGLVTIERDFHFDNADAAPTDVAEYTSRESLNKHCF